MGDVRHEYGGTAGTGDTLSRRARSLWAKTDPEDDRLWLPLYVHAADTAQVMAQLWDKWVPKAVRELLSRQCEGREELARKSLVFLAGAHDIGKATPIFQAKPCGCGWEGEVRSLSWKPEKEGLPIEAGLSSARRPTHPIAGQVILDQYLKVEFAWPPDYADAWGSVVGAHHGNVPEKKAVNEAFTLKSVLGLGPDAAGEVWRPVQRELLERARGMAGLSREDMGELAECRWDAPTESVACGLLIMADWIASNQELFPLTSLIPGNGGLGDVPVEPSDVRARRAWDWLSLPSRWEGEEPAASDKWFCERFSLSDGAMLRPIQRAVMEAAGQMSEPSLMVIEAPMGEGKTEAALAAAEIVGARFGCGGVCVALPTMATTDAMFGRVHRWLGRLPVSDSSTVYLAHGKARLNEEYQGIVRSSRAHRALSSMGVDLGGASGEERVVVSDWMQGRKKGMLASFVVCTVDQVLMGALDMRHLSLRHLSLAGKVVIVDECHAYDSYMQQYLKRVLEWLGAWGCPVILLSATLPASVRDDLVAAYQAGRVARRYRMASATEGASALASLPVGGRSRKARARGVAPHPAPVPSPAPEDEPYPLITVASGSCVRRLQCLPSSRGTRIEASLVEDGDEALASLLGRELCDGGVAGVICDTVTRAQAACRTLTRCFGEGEVVLTHARFMDLDRMENETRLRALLGPDATRSNGERPERMVVVGTQVLEQSLDIDFDLLVTDVAPIDLLMQRLGRVHRHGRGADEKDRPVHLRTARCFVRGIEGIGTEGPSFSSGVSSVYDEASLIEALAVSGLIDEAAAVTFSLPRDIARLVRAAYSPAVRSLIPDAWRARYEDACVQREREMEDKVRRAGIYLLPSARDLVRNEKTLTGLFPLAVEDGSDARMNEDAGQRAVRDTQETVEALLVCKEEGRIRLLPWVGDTRNGVERGQEVPTTYEPDPALSMVLAQCAVRLPRSLCRPQQLDRLIEELESGCERWAAAWQGVSALAGRLALALEEARGEPGVFEATLLDRRVIYTREEGLATACREPIK